MDEISEQEDCPQSDTEALATPRTIQRAWEAERSALAPRIEEFFGTVTKRFRPPTRTGCRIVAGVLLMIRDADQHSRRDRVRRAPSDLQKSRRAAKCFLAALRPIREQRARAIKTVEFSQTAEAAALRNTERDMRRQKALAEATELYIAERNAELNRINEAARAVEAVLPLLSETRRTGGLDLLPLFASVVRRVWCRTNDGDAPRGANPDGPLVKFVTAALAEIGMNTPAETASAVLRGRRRAKKEDISGH